MNQAIQNLLFANEPSTRPASFLSGGGAAGAFRVSGVAGGNGAGVETAGAVDFREELASVTKRESGEARTQDPSEPHRADTADRGDPGGVVEQDKRDVSPGAEPADDAVRQPDDASAARDKAEDAAEDASAEQAPEGAADQSGQGETGPVVALPDAPVIDEVQPAATAIPTDDAATGEDAKQAAAAGLVPTREGEAKEGDEKRGPRIDQIKGQTTATAKASAESAAPAVATTGQPANLTATAVQTTTTNADANANAPLALQPVAKGPAEPAAPLPTAPSVSTPVTATTTTTAQALATAGPTASTVVTPTDVTAGREADNAALNGARLARGLASAVNQRGGAVTLRLTPPEMGTVRIQMQLTGTVLSAAMHTESASAHQMLTQQLGQLRTSLETQGLTVERLHVQTMQQAQPGNASEQNGDSEQQPQHNEGRSRGRQQGGDSPRDGAPGRDSRDNSSAPKTFGEQLESTTNDTSPAQQAA